jgi:cytochrome c553
VANVKTFRRSVLFAAFLTAIMLWGTALAAQDAAANYKAKCSACHGADAKGETPVGKKMGIKDLAYACTAIWAPAPSKRVRSTPRIPTCFRQ